MSNSFFQYRDFVQVFINKTRHLRYMISYCYLKVNERIDHVTSR